MLLARLPGIFEETQLSDHNMQDARPTGHGTLSN